MYETTPKKIPLQERDESDRIALQRARAARGESSEAEAKASEGGGKAVQKAEAAKAAEGTARAAREAVSIRTYFQTVQNFRQQSRRDASLTAAAQLVYRVLLEEANRSYWAESFTCSLEKLEEITHLAHQTVIDARMRLKSKGYMDFRGKPSRYTLYSLVDERADEEVDNRPPPRTPNFNTEKNLQNKTMYISKEEVRSERERDVRDSRELQHSRENRANRSDSRAVGEANREGLEEAIAKELAELRERSRSDVGVLREEDFARVRELPKV